MRVLGRVCGGLAACGLAVAGIVAIPATSGAKVTPGVTADFDLRPHESQSKTVDSVIINLAGEVETKPDACRDDPTMDLLCDAFRIKLHRNLAKDAINSVRVAVRWNSDVTVGDLVLVAAGLGVGELPDLDMYIYDAPDHALGYDTTDDDTKTPGCQGCEGVGGRGVVVPEIAGFQATQDEYDVVVQAGTGVQHGPYTVTVTFSDELFDKQGELLDNPSAAPSDASETPSSFRDIPGVTGGGGDSFAAPGLGLAPLTPDADIAGIGLGVSEQFDPQYLALGGAVRRTAAVTDPPSGVALVGTMVVLPLLLAAAGVEWLRRRRRALL